MSRWFESVDARPLYAFRILFGLLMAFALVRFAAKGWIDLLYVQPEFRFTYYGFAWVPRPGETGIYALFSLTTVAAIFVALGYHFRWAIVFFLFGFTWIELLDVSTYLNHYYLVSLIAVCLATMPAAEGWSIDARSFKPEVPAWTIGLLRFQVGAVYFFAGVAKLNSEWLLRGEPLATWFRSHADLIAVGPWLSVPAVAIGASWAAAVFDLSVPFLLRNRRARPYAYAGIVGFHLVTAHLFQLGMFPWIMMASALVFFDWPSPRQVKPRTTLQRPFVALAISVYIAVQVILPLRHWLYPGTHLWHEQGFRYAWHVMLVEKAGFARFEVRDPQTGRTWRVNPSQYLTPQQTNAMTTQPDLILQFAHQLRDDFGSRKNIVDPKVTVDSWVALHGYRSQRLVDPEVDLATQEDGLASKNWVLPHPELDASMQPYLLTKNVLR